VSSRIPLFALASSEDFAFTPPSFPCWLWFWAWVLLNPVLFRFRPIFARRFLLNPLGLTFVVFFDRRSSSTFRHPQSKLHFALRLLFTPNSCSFGAWPDLLLLDAPFLIFFVPFCEPAGEALAVYTTFYSRFRLDFGSF